MGTLSGTWTRTIASDVAYRRAGGRRRHNAERRQLRDARRERIKAMILADERPCIAAFRISARGFARIFNCHHKTTARDLAAIKKTLVPPAPCCALPARDEAEQQERNRLVQSSLRYRLGQLMSPEAVERILVNEHGYSTTRN